MENYLKIKDSQNRKAMSKLRTSSHLLKIETGRWTNIARDNRICTQCGQNTVEDEYHFLFASTIHEKERNISFEKIKTKTNINLFDASKHVENLKLLFKSDSLLCSFHTLGEYIKNSFLHKEQT